MALAYKKVALADDTKKGRIDLDDGASQDLFVLGVDVEDGSALTLMCRADSALYLVNDENDIETTTEVVAMSSGNVYVCYLNKAGGGEFDADVYSSSRLTSVTGVGTGLRLTGGQTEYILLK